MKEPLTKEEFEDVKKGILGSIKCFLEDDFHLWRLEGAIILLMELADFNVLTYSKPPLYKISINHVNKKVTIKINRQDWITLESHNHAIIKEWKEEICSSLMVELQNLKYEHYIINIYQLEDAVYSINDANCVRAYVSDVVDISCNEEVFLSLSYRQFIAMYELDGWLEEYRKEKLKSAYNEVKELLCRS
ncbi:MAG: hypothetical protein K2M30_02620 [Desulfovibrionaceae bacterium]|nr:hypothetical protein [Desulfovibrionaceae bacterium]